MNCGKGTCFSATKSSGCYGGSPFGVQNYTLYNGVATCNNASCNGGCLPYTESSNNCTDKCGNGLFATIRRASAAYRIPNNETAIMQDIYTYGPLSFLYEIRARYTLQIYVNSSEVITSDCTDDNDAVLGGHAISVVGWGVNDAGVKYWLLRNS